MFFSTHRLIARFLTHFFFCAPISSYRESSHVIGFQDKPLSKLVWQKYRDFPDLKVPDGRESVSVADVLETTNPQEHRKRVDQWAQTV